MLIVEYDTFRKNMDDCFEMVSEKQDTIMVKNDNENNVVLMSKHYYDSLMETAYLMSEKANREHLAKSIGQLYDGKITEHEAFDA